MVQVNYIKKCCNTVRLQNKDMSVAEKSLDSILAELGDFGKFQRRNLAFICMAVVYMGVHLSYVFTARDLNYRCKIEECDSSPETYNTAWLSNAVPLINGRPAKCEKYKPLNLTVSETNCSTFEFDKNSVERCDSYIYETSETTIVNDFNLHCNENLWKVTLVGTANSIGHFFCLPIAGFISDRYGRKTLLVGGLVLSAFVGLLRSFSTSYLWFLLLEVVDTTFGSGSYSCAFILGVELVGPERRVLIGTIISCAFTLGETLLGLIAWFAQSWRLLLRIIYPPGFLLLLYLWLTPESVRWLLAKGRCTEAIYILRKAANVNRKTISPNALEKLSVQEEKCLEKTTYPLLQVFKSLPLMIRLLTCSFCWMSCTFLFYGLSLNSVALSGNSYLNFIMTALIEIPAYFATYVMLDRIGRRSSQCLSFIITECSCFAFMLIPEENAWIKLVFYLTGKFGATLAFTVLYVFTSELFPTSLRHSLLATCSMLGRIGSMVAPQIPVLTQLWHHLPLVLFGSMATAAGLLSLTFPETLNTKLPDTIEEAEAIGAVNEKNLKGNYM